MTQLTYLDLSGCARLTEDDSIPVLKLTNLTYLNLSAIPLNSWLLGRFKKLTNLTHLDLSHTSLEDRSIGYLTRFTELRTLKLCGCPLTYVGVVSLTGLVNLEELDFRRCLSIYDDCKCLFSGIQNLVIQISCEREKHELRWNKTLR